MCKWMDKVVDGVEVYQVGKQQLWDWCAYNGREFTGWLPEHQSVHSYADSLRKGIYLVVEVCATFGRLGVVQLAQSYTSLKSAVKMARAYDDAMTACVLVRGGRLAYGYEVWHVVDDAELWQEWDNASAAYIALHQPEVPQYQPVVVDEQDTDYGRDTLCSVYVPAVGQNVSFLVCEYDATGETVEYVNDDWQGWQPLRLDRICYLNWHSAEEIANGWDFSTQLLDALRQLREAGE